MAARVGGAGITRSYVIPKKQIQETTICVRCVLLKLRFAVLEFAKLVGEIGCSVDLPGHGPGSAQTCVSVARLTQRRLERRLRERCRHGTSTWRDMTPADEQHTRAGRCLTSSNVNTKHRVADSFDIRAAGSPKRSLSTAHRIPPAQQDTCRLAPRLLRSVGSPGSGIRCVTTENRLEA
eukprot:99008-Rhodomonas_salina.1